MTDDVEEAAVQRGHEAGLNDGLVSATEEGRQVGLAKGAEVGAEIGYYVGACAVLRREARSERARRAIEAVEIMIRDSSQQSLHDLDLEALRVKFRAATSYFRLKANALAFHSPAEDRLGF